MSRSLADLHADFDARQVVDRYLMGKLSAAEEAQFEEHYLGCAECLEKLQYAERLQAAMKRTASQDATRLALGGVVAWLARFSRAGRLGLMSLAAVVLLLPSLWVTRELGERKAEIRSATAPQANTPILRLGTVRGGASLPVLELAPDTRWAVLSLALDPPVADSYRVALIRDRQEIWRADGLVPSPSETLDISLPVNLLPAGEYRLLAETPPPEATGKAAVEFAFRVAYLTP